MKSENKNAPFAGTASTEKIEVLELQPHTKR